MESCYENITEICDLDYLKKKDYKCKKILKKFLWIKKNEEFISNDKKIVSVYLWKFLLRLPIS